MKVNFYLKDSLVWFYMEGPTTTPSAALIVDVPAEASHKKNYPIAYRAFLESQNVVEDVKEVMVESSDQIEAKTLIAEPVIEEPLDPI